MENFTKKISHIEEQITLNIDLLEIAKSYCDYNFDKGTEICSVGALIGVILKEQREIADCLDTIL